MENPNTQNTNPASEARPVHQATSVPPLKVVVSDIHTGKIVSYDLGSMREAIHRYREIVTQARSEAVAPFVLFDELNWLATIKFRGGKIRAVAISNGEKVLGRSSGVQARARREEQEKASGPSQQSLPAMA